MLLTVSSYVPAYVLEAPLEGVSAAINSFQFPTFGDVDADGDLDLLLGRSGGLTYFKNIGNSTTPVFKEQSGKYDPFAGVTAALQEQFGPSILSNPTLADWDSDGDLDLALGLSSTILAFENTGYKKTMPNFVGLTGTDNPFDDVVIYPVINMSIAFGDLDGDQDLDAVLNSGYVPNTDSYIFTPYYLENQDGVFEPSTGVDNPFDQVFVGQFSSPELGDLDGDGDWDLVVARFNNFTFRPELVFYENTGSPAAASFGFLPATGSIVGQLDTAGSSYAPALGDLDDDGDQDLLVAMVGAENGPFQYFRASGDSRNAPVNTVGTGRFSIYDGVNITEDAALVFSTATFSAFSVADANADSSPLQITLEASHGTLTLATTSGLVFSSGDGIADAVLTFQGTLSDINAALDGLSFVPDLNYIGDAQISITTNDLGQPGGGVALFDSDSLPIQVRSVQETLTELRFFIGQFVSNGDLTVGQGDALLKNLVLTGDLSVDVRNLQTYLHIATGFTQGGVIPPGFEPIFLQLAEDMLTGLLTD